MYVDALSQLPLYKVNVSLVYRQIDPLETLSLFHTTLATNVKTNSVMGKVDIILTELERS